MEGAIFIRCREADKALIESVMADAVETYREMIVT